MTAPHLWAGGVSGRRRERHSECHDDDCRGTSFNGSPYAAQATAKGVAAMLSGQSENMSVPDKNIGAGRCEMPVADSADPEATAVLHEIGKHSDVGFANAVVGFFGSSVPDPVAAVAQSGLSVACMRDIFDDPLAFAELSAHLGGADTSAITPDA